MQTKIPGESRLWKPFLCIVSVRIYNKIKDAQGFTREAPIGEAYVE